MYAVVKNVQLDDIYQDPTVLKCFKYGAFSIGVGGRSQYFKFMLTDKCHSFTEAKLEMHLWLFILIINKM